MRYLALFLIAAACYQLLSFARYNWDNGNALAASGALLLAMATLVFPVFLIFFVD